ncbi:MAG: type II secretion system protein [Verrucomicrobia bacterium]|nr:type II secretion system protein [Verrucomicrobiota bacterium]
MKKRKRALTLLEIMIVIALITLISGVISYNMRGTLDKGRAFKTERAIDQLRDMLQLCQAENIKVSDDKATLKAALNKLGLAKDVDKLLTDGWGQPLVVQISDQGDIAITSAKLDEFQKNKK